MWTDSFITRHPPRTALNLWFTHVHSNQSSHSLFRNIFLLWFRFVPDSTETSPPNVSGVDAIQNLQGVSENLKCPAETIVHNISPRLCMSLLHKGRLGVSGCSSIQPLGLLIAFSTDLQALRSFLQAWRACKDRRMLAHVYTLVFMCKTPVNSLWMPMGECVQLNTHMHTHSQNLLKSE